MWPSTSRPARNLLLCKHGTLPPQNRIAGLRLFGACTTQTCLSLSSTYLGRPATDVVQGASRASTQPAVSRTYVRPAPLHPKGKLGGDRTPSLCFPQPGRRKRAADNTSRYRRPSALGLRPTQTTTSQVHVSPTHTPTTSGPAQLLRAIPVDSEAYIARACPKRLWSPDGRHGLCPVVVLAWTFPELAAGAGGLLPPARRLPPR